MVSLIQANHGFADIRRNEESGHKIVSLAPGYSLLLYFLQMLLSFS